MRQSTAGLLSTCEGGGGMGGREEVMVKDYLFVDVAG